MPDDTGTTIKSLGGFAIHPEQASTIAPRVDAVYWFLVAVSGLATVLIVAALLYFGVKYRRREGALSDPLINEEGAHVRSKRVFYLEVAWIAGPLAIFMVMFGWGASVYASMSRPPADATEIYVLGKQWMWHAQHMNGVREINELHVPVGKPVRLTMMSEDVIHSFFIPAFRVKQDVLPGRYTTMWFEATKPGVYHLFCTEYCGTKHSGMVGQIIVMEPSAYEGWLSGGGDLSLASQGLRLFQDNGCAGCHNIEQGPQGRGPTLGGLFGTQVEIQGVGMVTADEAYLRESILNPNAKVVAGFQPIMPPYQGVISEEGLIQIIAYIKSLAPPAGATGGAAKTGTPSESIQNLPGGPATLPYDNQPGVAPPGVEVKKP